MMRFQSPYLPGYQFYDEDIKLDENDPHFVLDLPDKPNDLYVAAALAKPGK